MDGIGGALAAAGAAGVGHVVSPSIVGAVRVPLGSRLEAGPSGAAEAFAGPPVERVDRLAPAWAKAHGVRRVPLPLPAAEMVLRAVRRGGLTDEPRRSRASLRGLARPDGMTRLARRA